LVTLASFWPVLHNDFINFDDPPYVTANPHVTSGLSWGNVVWAFQSNVAANWHPLTWLSHMLDVQLFGLRAGWHHLMSLLLHIANALLLFSVLRRMTGAEWRGALVAALFAVHPLHVESVAWVAERKDVLSTLFFMLTLWAYVRHAEDSVAGSQSSMVRSDSVMQHAAGATNHASDFSLRGSRFYLLSLLFFVLGLLSKPMLVTVPFVLLLLDYWPLGRLGLKTQEARRKTCRLLQEKIPFFCLAIACSALTFWVQRSKQAVTLGLPLALRSANAVVSYAKYLGHVCWPAKLAIFYQHPNVGYFAPHHDALHPASDQWPGWQIGLAALMLALVSLAALLRLKKQPWFAVGWFWYLVTLVPVIGIVQAGAQALADRYTYIPLIGIFICIVWAASEFFASHRIGQTGLTIVGSLAVAACALATHQQVKYWRNDLVLFEHALAVTGKNATAHYQVGLDLVHLGQDEAAMRHFERAVDDDPTMMDAYRAQADVLERLGRPEEALRRCQAALQVEPWLEWAHNRIIALLWKLGRRDEARQACVDALKYNPHSAEAHYNLAIALSDHGELAEAAEHLTEAVRLRPNYGEALIVLAELLVKQGRPREAEVRFREALVADSTNAEAHINLGGLLWASGRRDEAIQHYAEALRLNPKQPMAHYNMGSVLFAQGRMPEAADQFREALLLRSDYPEALAALGRVLAIQGSPREAVSNFQAAVKLRPQAAGLLNELARLLATSPQAEVRDGPAAVALAERACQLTSNKEPRFLATLDMAYAEAGRFQDAIGTADKTRELALSIGDQRSAQEAEARLGLYRKHQPYRQ
jgi:tetratricopeptide (TPR) repeat protein